MTVFAETNGTEAKPVHRDPQHFHAFLEDESSKHLIQAERGDMISQSSFSLVARTIGTVHASSFQN